MERIFIYFGLNKKIWQFLSVQLLLTFSWFAVPAELQADGGEQVPDELLDLLVEVGVRQQRG